MNPKKGPFDLNIDLTQIPSFKTRFSSLDRFGKATKMERPEHVDHAIVADPDLKQKIGSMQDPRSNPSVILRRNGIRV